MNTEIKKSIILKSEFDNSNIWEYVAISLGYRPDTEQIEVVSFKDNIIIPEPANQDIDKNLKYYKEAKWMVNRVVQLNTMSDKEIKAVFDMAVIIVKQELY